MLGISIHSIFGIAIERISRRMNIVLSFVPLLLIVGILLIGDWMWRRNQYTPRECCEEGANSDEEKRQQEKDTSEIGAYVWSILFCLVFFGVFVFIGIHSGNWLPLIFVGGATIFAAIIDTRAFEALRCVVILLLGFVFLGIISRGCWSLSSLPR